MSKRDRLFLITSNCLYFSCFVFAAKLEGEYFFDSVPKLCQVIASMCTISCVTSLMTISLMSLNRYVFICKQEYYGKVFTQRNSIIMCMSVYCIGLVLVLLNQAGIGDHSFDRKSLECIWDRMATYAYTVVFSVTLVWIPSLVIGICYLKVFLFVRNHSKKMDEIGNRKSGTKRKPSTRRNLRLQVFKTMFIIYIVFVSCWAPYALIMIIDAHNTFPYELHVIITVFAHLHPSVNWLIYYKTQKRFAIAYRRVLRCCVKADSDWNSNQTALSGSRSQQSGTSEDVL